MKYLLQIVRLLICSHTTIVHMKQIIETVYHRSVTQCVLPDVSLLAAVLFSCFLLVLSHVWHEQTCGSRDLSLGLETSRYSCIKVLVLVLEPLSLGQRESNCHPAA